MKNEDNYTERKKNISRVKHVAEIDPVCHVPRKKVSKEKEDEVLHYARRRKHFAKEKEKPLTKNGHLQYHEIVEL